MKIKINNENEIKLDNGFIVRAVALSTLPKGAWFTLKPLENPTETQVWIKGDYDRTDRKYEITNFSDINKWKFIKGNKLVYVDFIF